MNMVVNQPRPLEEEKPKKKLWVASRARGRPGVWHKVTQASWNLPMSQWSTACGWSFARKSSDVSMSCELTLAHEKCKKCKKCKAALEKLSDDVKEVWKLAELSECRMVQQLDA